MILPRDLTLTLSAHDLSQLFPLKAILYRFLEAEMEPGACRAALEDTIEGFGLDSSLFTPAEISSGGMFATERLLYPASQGWKLNVMGSETGPHTVPVDATQLGLLGDALRSAGEQADVAAFRERCAFLGHEVLDLLTPREVGTPRWPVVDGPGIYRREHASLLIASETTRLLVDPIGMMAMLPFIPESPVDGTPGPDAIFVTHGHLDHWHAPTILHNARSAALPVYVPKVPRLSLLSFDDFGQLLGQLGQNARPVDWGEVFRVGDIEVEVLPFYGEQPTRDGPGAHPSLRNWGNCYRFDTPDFSVAVLADSGADPAGSMAAVLRESARRRGPIDVVLSCLRDVDSPFHEGLPNYVYTLPFERVRELYRQRKAGAMPNTTAGVDGVLDICEAAGARYFLPYANGFMGVGRDITDIGWGFGEPTEEDRLEHLRAGFARKPGGAVTLSWNAGDVARFHEGRMEVRR